jgi:hypothetical protein
MRRTFDVAKTRERVFRDLHLSTQAVGYATAGSVVTDAVYAFICGLHEEGTVMAQRARQGLASGSALDHDYQWEPRMYHIYAHEAFRFADLALARWLETGTPDPASHRSAMEFTEKSVDAGRAYYRSAGNETVDYYMAEAVQAGEWARGLQYCEEEDPGAAKPVTLTRVQSARRVGYVLCRQAMIRQWDEADVHRAVDRFLSRNMGTWLANGLARDAARWLKIRYAHLGARLSPRDALARSLSYLRQ